MKVHINNKPIIARVPRRMGYTLESPEGASIYHRTMEKMTEEVRNNPEKAKELLISIGVMNEDGTIDED